MALAPTSAPIEQISLIRSIKRAVREVQRSVETRSITIADWWLATFGAIRPKAGEVMVVRLDAIGDFILWLDAAKELRRLHPGKRLVLVGNSIWSDLASRMGHWDEVWAIDLKRFSRFSRYRYATLAAIRRRGFEQALQPTFSRVHLVGDAVMRASGSAVRVGSKGDDSNMSQSERAASDRWYTRLVDATDRPLMEVERNAEFIRNLADPGFTAAIPQLPSLGDVSGRLPFGGPYRVVVPGATASIRQWPAEQFAQVINAMREQSSFTTVVCGSMAEKPLCQALASMIDGPVVELGGQTALWELVEVIRGAELLIGNETSTAHIAAAVETPTICVLGGGHYGRFMPYGDLANQRKAPLAVTHPMQCFGCNWHCSMPHRQGGPAPCITGISVPDVLDASQRILAS